MALAYLLDEHLRGPLWRAVRRHNATQSSPIDVTRVGDPESPGLGTLDPNLLIWAEEANRIIVTFDERTMPQHLTDHLATGRHVPGIFVIRPRQNLRDVLDFLVFAALASDESEWRDQIVYIP